MGWREDSGSLADLQRKQRGHSGGDIGGTGNSTPYIHSDGTVRDGAASPTPLAKRLPITQWFLKELGLDFFTVQIAHNDPDSWLRKCLLAALLSPALTPRSLLLSRHFKQELPHLLCRLLNNQL